MLVRIMRLVNYKYSILVCFNTPALLADPVLVFPPLKAFMDGGVAQIRAHDAGMLQEGDTYYCKSISSLSLQPH